MEQTVELRPLAMDSASVFARLHVQVFPRFPTTHLGIRFCTKFYRAYVERADTVCFGAWKQNELVGLVVGGPESIEQDIKRELQVAGVLALACRPWLLFKGFIWQRIRRLEGGSGPSPVEATVSSKPAGQTIKLVNIGVSRQARGEGIAKKLIEVFVNESARRGFVQAILVVDDDNTTARKLYERQGWRQVLEAPIGGRSLRYAIDIPLANTD